MNTSPRIEWSAEVAAAVAATNQELAVPKEEDFVAAMVRFENDFGERLREAGELGELYRPSRALRVQELVNSRELHQPSAGVGGERPNALLASVQSTSSFYSSPWVVLSLQGAGSLCYPPTFPRLLRMDQMPLIEPGRDVFRVPKIPFQAEGPARHFLLHDLTLNLPQSAGEPVLVTVAIYDREMQHKLTADVCFAFSGSLKQSEQPAYLQAAIEQASAHLRRGVLSVASASREFLLVFRFHKLFRATESQRRVSVVTAMKEDERKQYDKETLVKTASASHSRVWEQFGVAFCPTLRQATSQGFVTSRGNSVRTLEPLSGHVELREIYELVSSNPADMFALLAANSAGPAAGTVMIEGSVGFDVDVEWPPAMQNAFLEGQVEVAEPFASSLTVACSAGNVLFVSPLRVLGQTGMFPADAALVVRVSFRPNHNSGPIPLVYQCSCLGGDATAREFGWSTIARAQNFLAEFNDEIRVQLPVSLDPEALLVLTVARVDPVVGDCSVVATLNIPLFMDANRVLENGPHSVLLGINTPTHAVTKGDTLTLPALKFYTRFISSVYLQDATTNAAVKHLWGTEKSRAMQTIVGSMSTIPRPIERANFPILLSGLMNVMYNAETSAPAPQVAAAALTEAVSLLDRLHMTFPDSSSLHHPFLLSYTSFVFSPPGPDFAAVLTSVWLQLLADMSTPGFLEKMTLSRSWVLLDMLVKSLVLSKSVEEIDAAQEAAIQTSPLSMSLAKHLRGTGSGRSPHLSSDLDMSMSPSGSATPSPRPNLLPGQVNPRRISTSIPAVAVAPMPVMTSSPHMSRKTAEKSLSATALLKSLPSSPREARTMQELRNVPLTLAEQLKSLLGRLMAITKTYENSESANFSVLEVAKLLRFAFTCLDRGFCLDLLQFCLAYMDTLCWSDWTVPFLSIVLGMGNDYVAVNMPTTHLELGNVSEFQKECDARHPLIGLLLQRLKRDAAEERLATSKTIWLVVALLAQHDSHPLLKRVVAEDDEEDDSDEASPKATLAAVAAVVEAQKKRREAVMSMYFPFVLLALDLHANSQLGLGEGAHNTLPWFTSSLFILSNMSQELRQMWFFVESVSRINNLFDFLEAGCKRCKGTPLMLDACLAVLDVLSEFNGQLISGDPATSVRYAPFVFSLLNSLFDTATALDGDELSGPGAQFVHRLYATAESIAAQNLTVLFDEQHAPYCQMLVIPTIFMCNSKSDALRDAAAKFLWRLICLNDEHKGSFVQVRLACTIAISRLVTEKKAGDTYLLKKALDAVVAMASSSREELQSHITEMMNRLFSVLKSTVMLTAFENEPEMKVDICFRISEGYSGSPDLRVTWLKIVAALHQANKDFLEAAQAQLVVAYLIAQYLEVTKLLPPGLNASAVLARICPAVQSPRFVGVTREDANNQSTALRLEVWTIEGFGNVVFDAAMLLADAGLYDWSLECYNLLIALRKPLGQWLLLLKAYAGAQMACKSLLKTAQAPTAETKYFRVCFVGASFDKLSGKAFVYRGDSSQRLMDFSSFLVKRCQDNASAYGASKVELMGNDKEATKEQMEQREVLYLQIARVYPSGITSSGVVSEFLLDMAHSDQSKQQQLVASQGRKKIYFSTSMPFPR